MDISTLLVSSGILGGVGLTFGLLIAVANLKLKVYEDPRIDDVSDLLPGANCGACGFAGCRAFAEAVIKGRPGAVENYMNLLKAGGSDYPHELLKKAGVDMTSPEPYRAVFTRMNAIMDQIESILDQREGNMAP